MVYKFKDFQSQKAVHLCRSRKQDGFSSPANSPFSESEKVESKVICPDKRSSSSKYGILSTVFDLMTGGIYGGGMMNCGFGGWGMGYMGMYGGLGCGLGVGGFLGR
ncbi:hypothetical protein RB195_016402 [Necator americanus]|uniref:Uncharacterized protein n=1 Tax=Necator americanus TaxID=51031 RepID=A0ABR1E910_NECAM